MTGPIVTVFAYEPSQREQFNRPQYSNFPLRRVHEYDAVAVRRSRFRTGMALLAHVPSALLAEP
jgi:hypothetical protein